MRGSLADEQSLKIHLFEDTTKTSDISESLVDLLLQFFRLKIPGETLVTMKRNMALIGRLSHFPGTLVAITIQMSSLIDLFAFLMGQTEGGISEGLGLGKRLTRQLLGLHPHID